MGATALTYRAWPLLLLVATHCAFAKEAATCPEKYPICGADRDCVINGAKPPWYKAATPQTDPGAVAAGYNYIDGYNGLGANCSGNYVQARGQVSVTLSARQTNRYCACCAASTKVGHILVAYVSFRGTPPLKSKDQVRRILTSAKPPSLGSVLRFSSWGKTVIRTADVSFVDLDAKTDPDTWDAKHAKIWIYAQAVFKKARRAQSAALVFGVVAGSSMAAGAQAGGHFSFYRGAAINWWTFAHEVGLNWGLGHANAFSWKNSTGGNNNNVNDFLALGDVSSVMGSQSKLYSRSSLPIGPDFAAVARYNLGWIPEDQVVCDPPGMSAWIRSLNAGPRYRGDGAFLVLIILCQCCKSGNPKIDAAGGRLFVSYRVHDWQAQYGVPPNWSLHGIGSPNKTLKAVWALHVHFQPTNSSSTELWSTLQEGESLTVPMLGCPVVGNGGHGKGSGGSSTQSMITFTKAEFGASPRACVTLNGAATCARNVPSAVQSASSKNGLAHCLTASIPGFATLTSTSAPTNPGNSLTTAYASLNQNAPISTLATTSVPRLTFPPPLTFPPEHNYSYKKYSDNGMAFQYGMSVFGNPLVFGMLAVMAGFVALGVSPRLIRYITSRELADDGSDQADWMEDTDDEATTALLA